MAVRIEIREHMILLGTMLVTALVAVRIEILSAQLADCCCSVTALVAVRIEIRKISLRHHAVLSPPLWR